MKIKKINKWVIIGLFLFALVVCPTLYVKSSSKVLFVGETKYFTPILGMFAVDSAVAERVYQLPDNFDNYDLVILGNQYNEFSDKQQESLVTFVKNGKSLIVFGGAKTFGNGHYAQTKLGNIFPVELKNENDFIGRSIKIQPDDKSLGFDKINYLNYTQFKPKSGSNILATANDEVNTPLIIEQSVGKGRVMVIAGYDITTEKPSYYESLEWGQTKLISSNVLNWATNYSQRIILCIVIILLALSLLFWGIIFFLKMRKRESLIYNKTETNIKECKVKAETNRKVWGYVFDFTIFLILMILIGWKLLKSGGVPRQFEAEMYYAPMTIIKDNIKNFGHFPMWNSYWWGGHPLDISITFIRHFLFWSIPVALVTTTLKSYAIFTILYPAIAGFGIYLLTRKITNNRFAAILAGLIYEFTPFICIENFIWGHWEITVAWMMYPYLFMAVDWALKRKKIAIDIFVGSIMGYMVLLSAEGRMLELFIVLAVIPYGIFYFFRKVEGKLSLDWKVARTMIILGILTILGACAHLLPLMAFQGNYGMLPITQPYYNFDITLSTTPNLIQALALMGHGIGNPIEVKSISQFGWKLPIIFLPLFFAFFAILYRKASKKLIWFFIVGFIISLMFVCGGFSPVFSPYHLIFKLPTFSFMKVPFRILSIESFFLSVLAGIGFASLLNILTNRNLDKKLNRIKYFVALTLGILIATNVALLKPVREELNNVDLTSIETTYQDLSQENNRENFSYLKLPNVPFELPGDHTNYNEYIPNITLPWVTGLIDSYFSAKYKLYSYWGGTAIDLSLWRERMLVNRDLIDPFLNRNIELFNSNVKFAPGLKYILTYDKILSPEVLKKMDDNQNLTLSKRDDLISTYQIKDSGSRIFYSTKPILAYGGNAPLDYEILAQLGFDGRKTPIIFTNDALEKSNLNLEEVNKQSPSLVLANSDWMDFLTDTTLNNTEEKIDLQTENYTNDIWKPASFWQNAYSTFALATDKKGSFEIPFSIKENADYDIFIRTFDSYYSRGGLSISLDGNIISKDIVSRDGQGFHWIRLIANSLKTGKHSLTFENDGTAPNDVDAVNIIKTDLFESNLSQQRDNYKETQFIQTINHQISPINGTHLGSFKEFASKSLDKNFYLPYPGKFKIELLGVNKNFPQVSVDGTVMSLINLSNIELEAGSHKLVINTKTKGLDFDSVTIKSAGFENPVDANLNTLITKVGVDQSNSGSYQLNLDADQKGVLTVGETYFPAWKAVDLKDNHIYQNVIVNGVFNGFIIDRTGNLKIKVFYDQLPIVKKSNLISLIPLFLSIIVLTCLVLRRKKVSKNRKI